LCGEFFVGIFLEAGAASKAGGFGALSFLDVDFPLLARDAATRTQSTWHRIRSERAYFVAQTTSPYKEASSAHCPGGLQVVFLFSTGSTGTALGRLDSPWLCFSGVVLGLWTFDYFHFSRADFFWIEYKFNRV
jgi:hypothetical protein